MRTHHRPAFTLIELLVVIAIIAILAAILFPVFAKAREKARQSSCSSNCKQVELAIQQYTNDYDETYPIDSNGSNSGSLNIQGTYNGTNFTPWTNLVQPYAKNWQLFQCPSGVPKGDTLMGYWSNGLMFRQNTANQPTAVASITRPSETVRFYDDFNNDNRTQLIYRPRWGTGTEQYTSAKGVAYTSETTFTNYTRKRVHSDGLNVAFADGHVKWQKQEDLVALAIRDPEAP